MASLTNPLPPMAWQSPPEPPLGLRASLGGPPPTVCLVARGAVLERVEPPGKGVWGCGGGHGMGGTTSGSWCVSPHVVLPPGLQPDRAAEGAAGPAEGHGGDAAVPARRWGPLVVVCPPPPGVSRTPLLPWVPQCPPAIQGILTIPCYLGLGHTIHHPGSPNDTQGTRITGGGGGQTPPR